MRDEIELWRLPTVMKKTGLSRSEIYRRVAARTFPRQRVYPGTTKAFWVSTEVEAWLTELLTLTAPAAGRTATSPGTPPTGR